MAKFVKFNPQNHPLEVSDIRVPDVDAYTFIKMGGFPNKSKVRKPMTPEEREAKRMSKVCPTHLLSRRNKEGRCLGCLAQRMKKRRHAMKKKIGEWRFGSVCEKHPELAGKRYTVSYRCPGCVKDANHARYQEWKAYKEGKDDTYGKKRGIIEWSDEPIVHPGGRLQERPFSELPMAHPVKPESDD